MEEKMSINGKWKYEDLTWDEVNQAVENKLIPVLPVGTIEQHGPHLPIKMDRWTATEISKEECKRHPSRLLFMPEIPYGYTTHVMDFPGSVTIHHETFIRYVVDVLKSVAYHGFKKIIVINGHGSNMPPLDLAIRRVNMETSSEVSLTAWWNLTAVNPDFMSKWRESKYPGGCAHAGEAETSLALHLDENIVNMENAKSEKGLNKYNSSYQWIDLWAAGPVNTTSWTSTFTDSGICGEADKATKEKGKMIFEEAVKNLIGWADEFFANPKPKRIDHHVVKPDFNVPG